MGTNYHQVSRASSWVLIYLTQEQYRYNKMQNSYRCAINRYHNVIVAFVSLINFITGFKKGFSGLWQVFTSPTALAAGGGGQHASINKFKALIDCVPPEENRIKSLFYTWNKPFLESRMRIFKFKYYNNILVAHYDRKVPAECTFCNISGPARNFPASVLLLSYCTKSL